MARSAALRVLLASLVLGSAAMPALAKDKNLSFGSFGITGGSAWGSSGLWLSADGDSYIQKYRLGTHRSATGTSQGNDPLYVRYRFRLSSDEVARFSAFLRQHSPWGTDCRPKQIVYDVSDVTIWQKQEGKLRAVCQPPEPLHRSAAFWAVYKFADKLDGTGPSIEIYRGGFNEWSPPGFPTDAEIRKALRNTGG
ncbi:hypothetical protein [Labrys sp. (in: a-proteobacteria)]|uniref:hypothetical protein n=1 Tax=Labrys sp. (in: a-proteobacteria) TaxID=1917972 RepID=UPI0039E2A695